MNAERTECKTLSTRCGHSNRDALYCRRDLSDPLRRGEEISVFFSCFESIPARTLGCRPAWAADQRRLSADLEDKCLQVPRSPAGRADLLGAL
jgi:hypothetical protein